MRLKSVSGPVSTAAVQHSKQSHQLLENLRGNFIEWWGPSLKENACSQKTASRQCTSFYRTSEEKKMESSFLKYICCQLLSGSLSSSRTVGGKSPYVPWENCVWVSHSTVMREIRFFFIKCWEPVPKWINSTLFFSWDRRKKFNLKLSCGKSHVCDVSLKLF